MGRTIILKNIIEVDNVTKLFGKDGIWNIYLNIKEKDFHVLIGSNDVGKTTLIRTILRLYQKYDGEIRINSILINHLKISENATFPNEFNAEKHLEWSGILANKNIIGIKVEIEEVSKKFYIVNILKKT